MPTHILGLGVKYLSFPPNILISSQRRFPWCVHPPPPAPHGRLLTILNALDSPLLSLNERNTLGKPEVLESEGLHNQPQQRWKVRQLLCPQLGPFPEGDSHFPLDPQWGELQLLAVVSELIPHCFMCLMPFLSHLLLSLCPGTSQINCSHQNLPLSIGKGVRVAIT